MEDKITSERKVIEVYVTSDKEKGTISFNVKKAEETEVAEYLAKAFMTMFNMHNELIRAMRPLDEKIRKEGIKEC